MSEEKNTALLKADVEEFEADVIEALLRSSGIPVLRISRLGGGYMGIVTGVNHLGIDMYVPVEMLDEAKSLLEAEASASGEDEIDLSTENSGEDVDADVNADKNVLNSYEKRRSTGRGVIRAIIIVSIALLLYLVFRQR